MITCSIYFVQNESFRIKDLKGKIVGFFLKFWFTVKINWSVGRLMFRSEGSMLSTCEFEVRDDYVESKYSCDMSRWRRLVRNDIKCEYNFMCTIFMN